MSADAWPRGMMNSGYRSENPNCVPLGTRGLPLHKDKLLLVGATCAAAFHEELRDHLSLEATSLRAYALMRMSTPAGMLRLLRASTV